MAADDQATERAYRVYMVNQVASLHGTSDSAVKKRCGASLPGWAPKTGHPLAIWLLAAENVEAEVKDGVDLPQAMTMILPPPAGNERALAVLDAARASTDTGGEHGDPADLAQETARLRSRLAEEVLARTRAEENLSEEQAAHAATAQALASVTARRS